MERMQLLEPDHGRQGLRLHVGDGVVDDGSRAEAPVRQLQQGAAPVVSGGGRATYPIVTRESISWLTACLEIPIRVTRSRPLSPGSACDSALRAHIPRWGRSPNPGEAICNAPETGQA